MKKIFFLTLSTLGVCCSSIAWSQTSLNAGSNSKQLNNEIYEYAIGEMTLVSTIQTSEVILTQGFLQPHIIVEKQESAEPAEGMALSDNIKVYPNPTENILFIEYTSSEASIMSYQLYDAASRMIINTSERQVEGINKFKLDVSSFAAGSYFLIIKKEHANKAASTYTYKIQKIQ